MTPLGFVIITLSALAILGAPSRKWASLAFIGGSVYVTQGQGVSIAGLSIFSTRILEIAGLLRIITRSELQRLTISRVDILVVILNTFVALVYCLRASDGQVNQIGTCLDNILSYLIFRSLIGTLDDFVWLLKSVSVLLVPYVLLVLSERQSGISPWFSMGGLSTATGWTRNDIVRCQGSFRHPSLLGTFGASFLPYYIAMWRSKLGRNLAYVGVACCLMLVWESNSGGPMNFAAIGIVGWFMWRMKSQMKWLRRGLVILFIILAIAMKAPVWFVLERISDVTGGDGWHRSELIDHAVKSIGSWWLWGMDLRLTASWFPYELDSGVADICDQFVLFGVQAGIFAILLFAVLLRGAFAELRRSLTAAQNSIGGNNIAELFLWASGVVLTGHIFNWLGITYFDQTYVLWSLQLAALVALSQEVLEHSHATQVREAEINPQSTLTEDKSPVYAPY